MTDSRSKPDRKRTASDMEVTDIESLSQHINGVNNVCHKALKFFQQLTVVVENLLVKNAGIKAELNNPRNIS